MSSKFVVVEDLRKHYNSLKAVDGISFSIDKGEVFGLLGPNGAGKTTTVEIMEGLRKATSGTVRIDGRDPQKADYALKEQIGVQLQKSSLDDNLKAGEALWLFGSCYKKSLPVDDLLKLVGLEEKKNTYYSKMSGGQQQRLSLAIALVNDPGMVFLDEPTTGLDAQARRTIWDIIRKLKSEGKSMLLTTHYIEEAELLCDRVAIIDHGKIIALGKPSELISQSGIKHRILFKVKNPISDNFKIQIKNSFGEFHQEDDSYSFQADDAGRPLVELVKLIEAEDNELLDLHLARPTLEDVFIDITGRRIRD